MSKNKFIVFGMPRCGTTYLYHMLGKHPNIFMPYRKESMYFSANYFKGEQWFESLFADIGSDQIGADVDPLYYIDSLAIDRILEYDPNMKVILGVRHPVSFAKSLHGNIKTMGWEVGSVVEMCQDYRWQLRQDIYIDFSLTGGFLSKRVQELQDVFKDNLLIYDFAYFQKSPLHVMQAIEKFLALPRYFDDSNVENIVINATHRRNIPILNWLVTKQKFLDFVYAVMPDSTIRKLRSLFDRMSVVKEDPVTKKDAGDIDDADSECLQKMLETDTVFYEQLFAAKPVIVSRTK